MDMSNYSNRSNKYMNLLVHDKELLKNKTICDKISNLLEKQFDRKPVWDYK